MKLKEIAKELKLEIKNKVGNLDREVTGGYASDLLSDVLANAEEGNLWVTLQTHPNIAAVANVKGLSAIVVINNREPEVDTLKKAAKEDVPIFISKMSAFEFIGKLYALGI